MPYLKDILQSGKYRPYGVFSKGKLVQRFMIRENAEACSKHIPHSKVKRVDPEQGYTSSCCNCPAYWDCPSRQC